jgi:hypothetical protein
MIFFILTCFCFFGGVEKQRQNKEPTKKTSVLKKQLNHYKLFSLYLIMKEDLNAVKQMVSFLEQL